VKITRLELKAFGRFTDHTLHLGPGLHIVHGPNEAGKSTTLRALKAWLFGFPERTLDNFLHANDQLSVGGCLESEDGRELAFYRRKKRKADILDPQGNPLAAETLAAFLPITEQAVFESLYGLTHEDLIKGGEDILAQKGEVGQALFSAGAGISSLRGVLSGLESEAEALFTARGTKREINEALTAYKETQKIVREASLSSRDWHELNHELQAAQVALKSIEEQHGQKDRRRRQLERIRQLLPQLALRNALRQQLAELGQVVDLPDYRAVLDAADAIESLQQGLGSYNKARKDLPEREGMRITCKREAAEFLRMVRQDIPLDQVETLRPVSGRRKIIGDLAIRHKSLEQGIAQTEKELRNIQREITILDGEIARLPEAKDASDLGQACRLARKAGAIDADLIAWARRVEDKKRDCLAAMDRLPLWSGDLEQILSLPLPLLETVRKYEAVFQAHDEQQRDTKKEKERLQTRLAKLQADIRQLEVSGRTPTEEELVAIRSQRDLGWELLRRQWLKGEDLGGEDVAFANELPLPEAYEKKVVLADTVADRLRHEADRVQAFAALRTEQRDLTEALADLEQASAKNSLAFTAIEAEWRALWEPCAMLPLPPKEMLAWLVEAVTLRDKAEDLLANERELAQKTTERQEIRATLSRELMALSEKISVETAELEPLLLQGEAVFSRISGIGEKRNKLIEKKADLLEDLALEENKNADFRQELEAWQREWREFTAELGGAREIHPAEAGDLLENLHSCFSKLKEVEDLRRRIDGISRDNELFVEAALTLAKRIAPALVGQSPEEMVAQLRSLLNQADRLAQTEKTLIEGAGGLSLAELEAQAAQIDPDALPEELARLTQELEQVLAPEAKRLNVLIGEKSNQLRQMDGNAKAAEAAEQGAQLLARIRRLAERYIQLKLAGHVLKSEIERFRSENQAPVLAIASRYFSELTLGSFAGLRTDEDDQSQPMLVGTRPNGARVLVERMSSGTRDQLYLALRLASLEWRLANHEPMPFILDDILVNADDARSRAALKILGELAAKTQVILFTHHRRIVDEARQMATVCTLQVHELGA